MRHKGAITLAITLGWGLRFGEILLLIASAVVAGCASVARGTDEQVTFDSEPAGAEMRSLVVNPCNEPGSCAPADDRYATASRDHAPGPSCLTPCTISVKRNADLIVTFSKPGFESQTVPLNRVVAGGGAVGLAGNVVLGGAVGMVTDSVTGAAYDHAPNPLKVVLVPVRAPEQRLPPRRTQR